MPNSRDGGTLSTWLASAIPGQPPPSRLGAAQRPDVAIGVASVSGWIRKETYGESNFLFEQSPSDVSQSFVEPALKAILEVLSPLARTDLPVCP